MSYPSDQEMMDELSAKQRETLAELKQLVERCHKALERAAYYGGKRNNRRAKTLEAEANSEMSQIGPQITKLREQKLRLEKLLGILRKAGFSESQFEPITEKDAAPEEIPIKSDELATGSYNDPRND